MIDCFLPKLQDYAIILINNKIEFKIKKSSIDDKKLPPNNLQNENYISEEVLIKTTKFNCHNIFIKAIKAITKYRSIK